MANYEPSYYNDSWTVLQKICYLSNWCKVNTVDIKSITFTYTDPDEEGKYTVTISGKNYKGETVFLGTVPAYKGATGAQGEQGMRGPQGPQGEQGAAGTQITEITSETAYISGENMVTPIMVTLSDSTEKEFTIIARNGATGAAGKDGTNFYIVGNINTAAELPANPQKGESAYLVGEDSPRDLYVYDYLTNAWTNQGTLQGIKGDTGAAGKDGANGVGIESMVSISHTTVGDETVTKLQVNYTEGKEPTEIEVHAQNGATGAQGEQGAAGVNGKDYLIYRKIIVTETPLNPSSRFNLNVSEFNRTPNAGEIFNAGMYEQHPEYANSKYFFVILVVDNVEGNIVSAVPGSGLSYSVMGFPWEYIYNHYITMSTTAGTQATIYLNIKNTTIAQQTPQDIFNMLNGLGTSKSIMASGYVIYAGSAYPICSIKSNGTTIVCETIGNSTAQIPSYLPIQLNKIKLTDVIVGVE